MTDRITPYREGGSIRERIDEIVAENASVHFEMMDSKRAFMSVTSNGIERQYCLVSEGGELIMLLQEESPA